MDNYKSNAEAYNAGIRFALTYLVELYGPGNTDIESTDLWDEYVRYAI